jgi:hypothetical protein
MAFKDGAANRKGRPKGAKNKVGQDLRQLVSDLLEQQFEKVQHDFNELRPSQRVRMFAELLPFAIPKMREVDTTIKLEQLSDQDLDKIINKIYGNEQTND